MVSGIIIFGIFIILIIFFAYQNYNLEQFESKKIKNILNEIKEQPVLIRYPNIEKIHKKEVPQWESKTGWKFSWIA